MARRPQIRGRGITAKEVREILADGSWKCHWQFVEAMGEVGANPAIGPMLHKMHDYGHLKRRLKRHPHKRMRVWYYKLKTA